MVYLLNSSLPFPFPQGPLPPMTRPWQSEVPSVVEGVTDKIQFPTDEENDGLARIAWRGPSALVSDDMYIHVTHACYMHVRTCAGSLFHCCYGLSYGVLVRDVSGTSTAGPSGGEGRGKGRGGGRGEEGREEGVIELKCMVKPQLGHDQVVSEYRWSQGQ